MEPHASFYSRTKSPQIKRPTTLYQHRTRAPRQTQPEPPPNIPRIHPTRCPHHSNLHRHHILALLLRNDYDRSTPPVGISVLDTKHHWAMFYCLWRGRSDRLGRNRKSIGLRLEEDGGSIRSARIRAYPTRTRRGQAKSTRKRRRCAYKLSKNQEVG